MENRLSFMCFLGLSIGDCVPDAKTIWLFREQLGELGLVKKLFDDFNHYLAKNGFEARKGQIVDTSIVEAPKQRDSREVNKQIRNGDIHENWTEKKLRHKDIEADWVKKNGTSYYGYKNHVEVDVKHKFIRKYKVTPSSVHDSNLYSNAIKNR